MARMDDAKRPSEQIKHALAEIKACEGVVLDCLGKTRDLMEQVIESQKATVKAVDGLKSAKARLTSLLDAEPTT